MLHTNILNERRIGKSPFVIICEHASALLPEARMTNEAGDNVSSHVYSDLGAMNMSIYLATLLEAPAFLAPLSRAYIDLNRKLDHPHICPETSDAVAVPCNTNLSKTEINKRIDGIHQSFGKDVKDAVIKGQQRFGDRFMAICMHSCTPCLNSTPGNQRPWEISLIYNKIEAPSHSIIDYFKQNSRYHIGDNQPYNGKEYCGYTVEETLEPLGVPYALFEIRNDVIATPAQQTQIVHLMNGAIKNYAAHITEDLELAIPEA